MEFLEKNWQWIIGVIVIPITIVAVNYFNNKRNNKNFLKQEEYKAHKENLSKINELINLATEAFSPIKVNPSKSKEAYLQLVKNKYQESKEILDNNADNFSKRTIEITKKIHEITLNCFFLQKKIDNFKTDNMPWDSITPLIDEITYIYSEDIKKEFPILRQKLTNEIKKLK